MFMFGFSLCSSFLLGMNQFLSDGVARSEVYWDVVLGEHSPDFHG